jgi:hypothetical protein
MNIDWQWQKNVINAGSLHVPVQREMDRQAFL